MKCLNSVVASPELCFLERSQNMRFSSQETGCGSIKDKLICLSTLDATMTQCVFCASLGQSPLEAAWTEARMQLTARRRLPGSRVPGVVECSRLSFAASTGGASLRSLMQ